MNKFFKNIFYPNWKIKEEMRYKHEQEKIEVYPPFSKTYIGYVNGGQFKYCQCDQPKNNKHGMAYCVYCDKRIPPELLITDPDRTIVFGASVIGVKKKVTTKVARKRKLEKLKTNFLFEKLFVYL